MTDTPHTDGPLERQYQDLVERSNDLIALLDAEFRVRYLNPAALEGLRLLGNGAEARMASGCTPEILLEPTGELAGILAGIRDAVSRGRTYTHDELIVTDDRGGCERSFSLHAYGIHAGAAVVVRETTGRLAMERNLRQADKMRSLGLLAGGVAHDFNNMLTGIKTFSQILERQFEEGSRQWSCVHNILESAERAADLTRQLLSFARQGDSNRTPEDLHRVLKDVISLVQHGPERNVGIVREFRARNTVVPVNRSRMHSAFLNVALNALESIDGGGTVTFSTDDVTVGDEHEAVCGKRGIPAGRYLAVTVRDTGCGMDRTVRERLFEPFFTTKEGEKGTGMGLATVFGTVRAHNGFIDVDSEPGRGTAFTVLLPVPGDADDADVPDTGTGAVSSLVGVRILVVDDEQNVRLSIQETLAEYRCELTICTGGAEAVAAVAAAPGAFDLVLLDMVMPGKDGLETLRELRGYAPDLRAVVMSGYSDAERKQRTIAEGVSAFVNKPFDIDVLVSAVRQALL